MDFKKYNSITNHYSQKVIGVWLGKFPDLKDEEFIIEEKVDGSNFSILFQKNKEIKFGKRTAYIGNNSNFFDFQNVMSRIDRELKLLQYFIDTSSHNSIRVFGEIYGKGVQKRVDYGEVKRFAIFDVYIDDLLLSPKESMDLLLDIGVSNLRVPIIKIEKGIFKALDFDSEFDTYLNDKTDNICEGIVIKPYNKTYEMNDSRFYIKKKNDKFLEKTKVKKSDKIINTNVLKLQQEFLRYVNDNRLDSVISKEGEINSDKEIGKYIKLLIEDAKDDFLKDNNVGDIDKKDLKFLFGKGNKIGVELIKGRL